MELLLFGPDDPRDRNVDSASAREAQQHLSGCAVCQSVAEKYRKADEMLGALEAGNRRSSGQNSGIRQRTADCPADEIWLSWAAGLLTDEEAATCVAHAAACSRCASLLREAMEDLAYNPTAEEQQVLAQLPTASPEWQRAMAMKLVYQQSLVLGDANQKKETMPEEEPPGQILKKAPVPEQKPTIRWWPKLAWATALPAVAVIAVAVGWLVWLKTREPDVNTLLAQAYTEHRTIELRMRGAQYGPLSVKKGSGDTRWPESFHLARFILSRDLSKHMDDPAWLQAQARADLLERNYQGALNEVDEALALKPNDSSLLIDKATTLYMRAHEKGHEMDFGEAADLLSTVLRATPDDPVALFNRALVYEKLNDPPNAIRDLERYLQIDPKSEWAGEAKKRLEDLKKRASSHSSAAEDLLDPAAFVRFANDPANIPILDSRIDDYQDRAIEEWLPQAYSGRLQASDQSERLKALQILSGLLVAHHADHWLEDLLGTAKNSPQFIAALNYLKQSKDESHSGNHEAAYKAARQSEQFFFAAGSVPGAVRAQWEQLHARQRQEDGLSCLTEASRLAPVLRDAGYVWIKIQFGIDRGACLWKIGSYDQGRAFVSDALKMAQASGFEDLKLRNLGMASSAETVAGDFASGWSGNEEGLQEYWDNPAAHPARAHQFYEDLAYASESMKWWHLAIAFATESARSAAEAKNQNMEILSWQYVAKLAIQGYELDTAAAAARHVADLSHSLTTSNSGQQQITPRSSRLYREITLAEIAIRQGKLSEAEKRLEEIQADISSEDTLALVRSFHLAKAELLEQRGRLNDAENEFLGILKIVDKAREKLKRPADQGSWSDENRGLYEALVYLEIKKGDSEKALNLWEWYRAADIRPPYSFNSVDEYLDVHHTSEFAKSLSNEILLSYALLPQGLVTWITDERGTRAYLTALEASLSRQAANYESLCSDRTSSIEAVQTQGRHLYEVFIAVVGDQLAADKTLVVDLDRTIGDLPFQALVMPDGHYLGQTYAIVLSPGLLYKESLRDPVHLNQNANALIVGSTATTLPDGTSLVPDEDAVREASEVAGRFAHPKNLFGSEASAERIQSALRDAELFHYSGHALSSIAEEGLLVFDSQRSGTTLWKGAGGNSRLFTNLQLAVLSACSTGRAFGNRREAHGVLVRSMLAAKVPNVVASRWDVESGRTRAFFNFFYDALFAGKSTPRAIQYAETKLMGDSQSQHPYYWAAFSAFGHA
jgi:CHAT domain-containing protein